MTLPVHETPKTRRQPFYTKGGTRERERVIKEDEEKRLTSILEAILSNLPPIHVLSRPHPLFKGRYGYEPRPSSASRCMHERVIKGKKAMAASGKRLVGKSVLITGAAQGIGRASAVVSAF